MQTGTSFVQDRLDEVLEELEELPREDTPDTIYDVMLVDPPSRSDVDSEYPDASWVEVDLVGPDGKPEIYLSSERTLTPRSVILLHLPNPLPSSMPAMATVMGFRTSTLKQTETATGLVRDLRLKDGPNLLLHTNWARMKDYEKIRALLGYPSVTFEDPSDLTVRVASIGDGIVLCRVTVFLLPG